MNLKKQTLGIAFAIVTALTMTASIVFGQGFQNSQSPSDAGEKTIQGVWRTVVTFRNCQTGDPIPNVPSFPGLFTFNEGGTMSEYGISPGLTPALRSPGHGIWRREHGWQEYSFSFIMYRYNASGVFLGPQKVTAELELGASGDEFTSSSSVQLFDANNSLTFNGCATAVGTRFE